MNRLIIMLSLSLLLNACVTNAVNVDEEKTIKLPALAQEKCGEYSFLYGVFKTTGNKGVVQGYALDNYLGHVYLLNLEPSERLTKLKGKHMVVVGQLHLTIAGLPYPDGRQPQSIQYHAMSNAEITQILEKSEPVDTAAIATKCSLLVQKK